MHTPLASMHTAQENIDYFINIRPQYVLEKPIWLRSYLLLPSQQAGLP